MKTHLKDLHHDSIEVENNGGGSVRIAFEQVSGRAATMRLDEDGCKEFIHAIAKEAGLEQIAKLTKPFEPSFSKGDIVSYSDYVVRTVRQVSYCEMDEERGEEIVWFTNGNHTSAGALRLEISAANLVA